MCGYFDQRLNSLNRPCRSTALECPSEGLLKKKFLRKFFLCAQWTPHEKVAYKNIENKTGLFPNLFFNFLKNWFFTQVTRLCHGQLPLNFVRSS